MLLATGETWQFVLLKVFLLARSLDGWIARRRWEGYRLINFPALIFVTI